MFSLQNGKKKGNQRIGLDTAGEFARLYTEYFPKVFRYISYKVDDISTVEDLTSEVFEKALTKFRSYREDRASFGTWVITIARNTVVDYYRASQQKKELEKQKVMEQSISESPEQMVIRSEEKELLRECLHRLSPTEQEILSLKFGADMTNRQIAREMGLSESNVGIMIYRAVRKLRGYFQVS